MRQKLLIAQKQGPQPSINSRGSLVTVLWNGAPGVRLQTARTLINPVYVALSVAFLTPWMGRSSILSIERTGTNGLQITTSNTPTSRFVLQSSSQLGPGAVWLNLGDSVPGGGSPHAFTSPHRPGLNRFFRLKEGVGDNDGTNVFDPTRVATIRLSLTESNFFRLTNSARDWVSADFEFDGERITNVAMRLKGDSSRTLAISNNAPYKVDFNRYVAGRRFHGLAMLNLNVMSGVPKIRQSGLEEYLSFAAFRDFGVPASRTGFAEVWLNGRRAGFYTTVQQIGGRFLKRNFDYSQGNLYQPEFESGSLEWRGPDISSYPNINFENGNDTNHVALLRFLQSITTNEVNAFDQVMDVEEVLSVLAGDVALGNWDDFSMGHNYYLYEGAPGRMTMIPWDLNLSQRDFVTPFQAPGSNPPLTRKLFASPAHRQLYLRLISAFLDGPASQKRLNERIDAAVGFLGNRLDLAAVEEMRQNIAQRVQRLRAYLASNPSDPALFLVDDLKDLSSFVAKLKQPSSSDLVSQYLSSQLASATRNFLSKYGGGLDRALQQALVEDLNRVIRNGPIYEPARFGAVKLSPETQTLLGQNPQGEDLVRLNRLLLDDAYPREISRMR